MQDQYFSPPTLNFYSYGFDNPILHVDATGRSIQDAVLNWLNQGVDIPTAVKRLRELYAMLDRILRLLDEAGLSKGAQVNLSQLGAAAQFPSRTSSGYYDFNVSIGPGVGVTGGRIWTTEGGSYWYLGVFVGTPGATLTMSSSSVTPGLNLAVGGSIIFWANQVGTNALCPIRCAFHEGGIGGSLTPLSWAIMLFWVW